jgi:hypothetical protein
MGKARRYLESSTVNAWYERDGVTHYGNRLDAYVDLDLKSFIEDVKGQYSSLTKELKKG